MPPRIARGFIVFIFWIPVFFLNVLFEADLDIGRRFIFKLLLLRTLGSHECGYLQQGSEIAAPF